MTATEWDTDDRFRENWFGEASQVALADLCGRTADLKGAVIEVGSWTGRSTVALANACHPQLMHAVDTWEGSPGEISADLASSPGRDVFAEFTRNVSDLTAGNVEPHRMGWREFFADFDRPIRLAFLDAEHSYVEVRDNLAAVLALLAPGGIVCGDDVHHPPVQQAVLELLPDAQAMATLWWWQKPLTAPTLAAEYERLRNTPSDIYEHLPTFVRLVRERNAQHVVELGTRTGVSTVAWLHALESTGGRLTSVDIDAKPPIGEFDHWTFVQGSDLDPAVFASIDDADIIFVDTSHLCEQTLRELNLYRHIVKPGGLVLCHDTELRRPETAGPGEPPFPVRRAVEEFCAAEGLAFTIDPRCWGLAVIEVP